MRLKGTWILFGFALIVGAFYFFYFLPAARERRLVEELSSRPFRLDAEKAKFLRLQNAQGAFELTKEGREWRIQSPIALPADGKTIREILDRIHQGKILKILTGDMRRAPEFGLDRPRAILRVEYEGEADELVLGGSSPSRTGIYAFARGVQAIFLADPGIAEALSVGLYELRAKALFRFDPEAVTRIRVLRRKGEIELVRDQQGWKMLRPTSGRASDGPVKDFLLGVLHQRADEFYDGRIPQARDYPDTMKLWLYSEGERTPCEIEVHYWGTGAHQGVVAYQRGMQYSGRLPRDFWNFMKERCTVKAFDRKISGREKMGVIN